MPALFYDENGNGTLDAGENEDWGRDYVLQELLRHTPEELAAVGIVSESRGP